MALQRIQIRRGLDENLPTTLILAGEPHVTTDRNNLYVGKDATTLAPVTPAIDKLTTLASINGAADFILIHDASEAAAAKEKKMTFNAFKEALNIPTESSDEKVAVVSGGTSGYLWGVDGTDGVIRMGSSMKWVKHESNGYVTIDVDTIDGGTF